MFKGRRVLSFPSEDLNPGGLSIFAGAGSDVGRGLRHPAPTWFTRLARILILHGRDGPAALFPRRFPAPFSCALFLRAGPALARGGALGHRPAA